jgi:hypothetical protein
MSPGAVAIPLLALGAAAALAWGAWAWVGRGRRRQRTHATGGLPAVPPAEGREGSAVASLPDEEPRPVSRGGWSLDLSDES